VAIRDVVGFAAGRYAMDVDPLTREVLSWVEYTPADVQAMAANFGVIRATGQGSPVNPGRVPITLEHGGPIVGWGDNVRCEGGKLLLDYVDLDEEVQRAYDEKRLYGHSATIEPNGEAVNFRGTTGPVLKDIAVLVRSHPRVKTLGSTAYSDPARAVMAQYGRSGKAAAFCARVAVGAGRVVTFAEVDMPDAVVGATGAGADFKTILLTLLMDAPGGVKNWAKGNAKALGLELPKEFQAPEEDKPTDAKPETEDKKMPPGMMSERAEQRLATLEAENKILRSGLETQQKDATADRERRRAGRFAEIERDLSQRYGAGPARDAIAYVKAIVGTADVFSDDGAKSIDAAVKASTKYMSPLHRVGAPVAFVGSGNETTEPPLTDERFAEQIVTQPGTSPAATRFFREHQLGKAVLGSMIAAAKTAGKVASNG